MSTAPYELSQELSDVELLQAFVESGGKNQDSFAKLYARHREKVLRDLRYDFGRIDEATREDACEDVFLNLLETATNFRGGSLSKWLRQAAHNRMLKLLQSDKTHAGHHEELARITSQESLPADSDDDIAIEKEYQSEIIRTVIDQLPDDVKDIFMLYLSGNSFDEIAKLRDKNESPKSLARRIALAEKFLRGEFSGVADDWKRRVRHKEDALLKRVQEDDSRCWPEFVEVFTERLSRYFRRYMHEEVFEDLCQETFLAVYKYRKNYKAEEQSAYIWVCTIFRNKFSTFLRRQKVSKKRRMKTADIDSLLHEKQASHEVESSVHTIDYSPAQIEEAVDLLPDTQRRVLDARVQGKEPPEIAEELNMNIGAVYTNLCRARKTCAEQILRIYERDERESKTDIPV